MARLHKTTSAVGAATAWPEDTSPGWLKMLPAESFFILRLELAERRQRREKGKKGGKIVFSGN